MSQVTISGNAGGTGIFTIASPNSNSNVTLTLPTTTGTVQVSGAPISGTTGTFTGLIFANGGGVQFPATQVVSGDANCLDDYEEGSWTPVLRGSISNPSSVSYNEQFGRYVKIGRQVTVQFYLATNSYSGGSGELRVGGLPFAAAAERQPTGATGSYYLINFQSGGFTFPSMAAQGGSTNVEFLMYNNNGAWSGPSLSSVPTGTLAAVQGTFAYFV